MSDRRPLLALRGRVVLAILVVALAPHALVFLWSQLDRPVPGRMWGNVRDQAETARVRLTRGELPEVVAGEVATGGAVRLRVADVADQMRVLADVDGDDPRGPLDRVEAFFLRPEGARTLRDVDRAAGSLDAREDVRAALARGMRVECRMDDLLYCEAITPAVAPSGRVLLVHAQESSFRAVAAVYQLRTQLLRLGLLVWPLAVVLAYLTASRIVRPIEHLRRQALERTKRTARTPLALEPEGEDEVADLAASLNALFDALARERAAHGEFVADLVHELKSPAATVRAAADALDEPDAPERTRRLARGLRESAKKLEATVDGFLDIARAEAGFPREERERVDLAALSRALVADEARRLRHPDVRFEIEAPEGPILVDGVADRLVAMLDELLDNGASFAPRGGHVAVRVEARGDRAFVGVTDDGPGVPEGERDVVFERFYTTRGQTRGTGLGLPFVRAVARAHGGDARLVRDHTPGAAFEIELPRAI